MRGKLIVIEGTDCSGKETQTNKLMERLKRDGHKVFKFSFPSYDSPTGRIIGGPYLGKDYICESWFEEGAINVNPKVASLYYAADRLYNMPKIIEKYEQGYIVFLDRYTYSNMAHQGAKEKDGIKRYEFYKWVENLEFKDLELPIPDLSFLLYMPYQYAQILRQNRTNEKPDQHEASVEHLKSAERAYLEIADMYTWAIINCVKDNQIRTIDDINDEVYNTIVSRLDLMNNNGRGKKKI